MAYDKPSSSANQIDKAGKRFFNTGLTIDERAEAINAIWSWRTAHSYPLNALHMTLRNRALKVERTGLTAQRLKRLPSILRKLGRQTTMQMSQMQDIGGCRAVVSTMPRLEALRFVYRSSPLRHDLTRVRDYIAEPKDDGYRSVHYMYRFSGKATSLPWDKLRIEVQMRTKLQHAWATCVETVDAFTSEDLKFGKGTSKWRRFFRLVGSVHAGLERTAIVPGAPANPATLWREVRELENELQVIRRLRSYAQLTSHITGQRGALKEWFLIQMLPAEGRVLVRGFERQHVKQAQQLFAESEKQFQGTKNQAVLVAASSVNELKKAYPNYFADTDHFTSVLTKYLNY
ncbi:MAG TPA: RelA/SpoT domain-containing protein [Xanthobacteraceae bacterium]|nr:RelA/SpoT domain-containing protein [Xanthobacteraceae bacterium]